MYSRMQYLNDRAFNFRFQKSSVNGLTVTSIAGQNLDISPLHQQIGYLVVLLH